MTIQQYIDSINQRYKLGNCADPNFLNNLQSLINTIKYYEGNLPLSIDMVSKIAEKLGLKYVPAYH
jgi:hypothetical protein